MKKLLFINKVIRQLRKQFKRDLLNAEHVGEIIDYDIYYKYKDTMNNCDGNGKIKITISY